MKAVVLAAGYATRLAPYTRLYPKSLLRVGGRPLLDATAEALAAAAVDEVVLVANTRFFPFFARWLAVSTTARLRPVTLVDDGTASNETRRGSVGDLVFAMERAGLDDDLLVICSDKLFSFSIAAFLAFAAEKGGGANACDDLGDPVRLAGRHGCLVLDADLRIAEFQEKPVRPPTSIESIAFYAFPREALALIREYAAASARPDAPGVMMEWLCPRFPIYGWRIDGECLDVGEPVSYGEADRLAWDRGSGGRSVEVALNAVGTDEEQLRRAIEVLEAEPSVSMVHLAAARRDAVRLEAWVLAHPHLLPVDVLPAGRAPPAALCRARGASWYVSAARAADGLDFPRLLSLPATPESPLLIDGTS